MIVTGIERIAKRRNRVRVYVDGVAVTELPAAVARGEGLAPGRAVERAEIDAIVAKEQRRAAMATAAAMLARRPRSERQIRQRLGQRRTEPEVIDATIARLREVGLVNDAAYAQSWAESRNRSSPRGRRLVVQELRTAGVETGVATGAAEQIDDADAAYRLAASRMRSLARLERDAFRARLGALLQRRGFGWDVVRATVDRCWRESAGVWDAVDDGGLGAAEGLG
jgi:regulatory protein